MPVLAQNIDAKWPLTLKRVFYLLIPLFLLLLIFNKASLSIAAALILVALLYIYGREYIWLLLALSVPALVFGEIVYIPITINWVYEARVPEIFLFLAAAVYGLQIYLPADYDRIKLDRIGWLLLVYLILTLFSYTYVIDPRLFVFGTKVAAFSWLAYFLASNLLDTRFKLKAFFYGLTGTILVLSGQLFLKFYQLGFSSKFFFERNTITIPIGPIATTAAILTILVLAAIGFYYQLRQEGDKYAPYVFAAAGIGILAIFLTLGKAAIGSLLIGLAYIFVKIPKSRIAAVLLLFWFIVGVYLVFNPFFSGLFERLSTTLVDANTKFRLLEYETGWTIIKEHYLVGVGAGQQLYYYKKLLNFETAQLVNNYFFQSLIDLGVIGLSLFGLLFLQVLKLARRRYPASGYLRTGIVAALICAAFNGLFEVTIFALPYAICFWFILGAYKNLPRYQE